MLADPNEDGWAGDHGPLEGTGGPFSGQSRENIYGGKVANFVFEAMTYGCGYDWPTSVPS